MDPRIKFGFIGSYVAVFALGFVAAGVEVLVRELGGSRRGAEAASTLVMIPAVIFVITWFFCALAWIYRAWEAIPPEHRYSPALGQVKPGIAVGLFFIPCVNIIWMYVCNLALVSALNKALAAQRQHERVNPGFAMAACVLHTVPYCNLLFGPPLWFTYMWKMDKALALLADIDEEAYAEEFA